MTATAESTTDPAVAEAIATPFVRELVSQIRVQDAYGTYRNWSDELILKSYIISREQKNDIPIDNEIDPLTKSRIQLFYRAVAASIEKSSGQMTQVVLDLNHEGFGWALVFSGRLLLVCRTLRDAQRFGFRSFEKLAAEGTKLTEKGIALAEQHPEICRL
ncbi:MAG: NifX-associated nitrogen fixation protein [Spirulinaceae cyanobacterium RM2_2_10]|nr:NifX-associated nitrogen fixation protein [Spirulinaceae cyanobacterium SM2_1_0]NJO18811.1 NifX-associated nitrogen fixation protein [Spirulinaceae cyanobacterium RM2_2_10]